MPKLLDFIKEKDLTHQQVIDILNDYEPEDNSEEDDSEEENSEVEEDTEEEINDDDDDTSTNEDDDNIDERELINISRDELTEMITKAVEDKFKAKRKPPSKGKKTKKKLSDKNVIKRSPFEVFV